MLDLRDPLALLGLLLILVGLLLILSSVALRFAARLEGLHPLLFYPIYRRGGFCIGFSPILGLLLLLLLLILLR